MTTRCKVGDLVFASKRGKYWGKLMKILGPAPKGHFFLPNGTPHEDPKIHPSWIVDVIGSSIECMSSNGNVTSVTQGVAGDTQLRPIPAHLLPSIKV